jgi:hypothetical protein
VIVNAPGGRFTGTTTGVSNAAGSCGGDAAPESVFRVVLTRASDVFVTTHGTRFDTVVYLRNGCCGAELGCNNDMDGRRTSALSVTNLPAGSYDVFVDGTTAADAGAFTVDIFVSPTSPNPGESCGRPAHIANVAQMGTTCGFRDDEHPDPDTNCQSPQTDPSTSLDVVYYFVLDQSTTVSFDTCTATCFDTVLYVRDVCNQTTNQRVCNDDGQPPGTCSGCASSTGSQSRTAGTTLSAGVHYVVVDTFPNSSCGTYLLTPTGVPP